MPTLAQVNTLSPSAFADLIGPVYEHSPWIAERALAERPFDSRLAIHLALLGALHAASDAEKLALIRAHPTLAGSEAAAGTLTEASTREQRASGLDALAPGEYAELAQLNAGYRERFGFPFVIAARLNSKAAIFGTLRARSTNTPEQEIANALAQIGEIARLRLADLVTE